VNVIGIPIQADEQIFYSYEVDLKKKKKTGNLLGGILVLIGAVTVWFTCITVVAIPIGIYIIYKANNPSTDNIIGMILTSERFIAIPYGADMKIRDIPLSQIEDVECKRKKGKATHRSGWVAAAVNAGANAIKEHQQNKQAKTHPNYWTDAEQLHLVLSGGRMEKLAIELQEGPHLGPILATGLNSGWDKLVAIEAVPSERTVSLL